VVLRRTSTGSSIDEVLYGWFTSLIAIMLGRLKMTIAECEAAYDEISQRIFGKKHSGETMAFITGGYQYLSEPLVEAVRKLVEEKLSRAEGKPDERADPDALLLDANNTPDTDACKV
jgi:hypothetical protein